MSSTKMLRKYGTAPKTVRTLRVKSVMGSGKPYVPRASVSDCFRSTGAMTPLFFPCSGAPSKSDRCSMPNNSTIVGVMSTFE